MQWLGYWFGPSGSGPVDHGWLALGDLTVLMGANDVGKSRLLRRLEGDLDALEALSEGSSPPNALLFVEMEPDEFTSVFEAVVNEDAPGRGPDLNEYPNKLALLDDARDRFGSHPGATETLRLLEDSRTVAVEPTAITTPGGSRPGLLLHWCAPPLAELDPDLRTAVQRFVREDTPPDGDLDPQAPTIVIRIGEIEAPLLPAPVRLPVDETLLLEQAEEAVSQFLTVMLLFDRLQAGDRDLARMIEDGHALRYLEERPDPAELWLDDPGPHSACVRGDALLALELITRAANAARAPFLEQRYGLSVQPAPLGAWGRRPPLEISLLPHEPPTEGEARGVGVRPFPLADAADGLRLWAQLAVAEGLDALRTTTSHLLNTLGIAAGDVFEGVDSEVLEMGSDVFQLIEELKVTRSLPSWLGDTRPLPLEERLAWWTAAVSTRSGSVAARAYRAVRPPLYLVDEPERHLNPRLAREAARWLERWLGEHRSQAIVVSHAVAFLAAGPDTSYTLVERGADWASLRPFSPDELNAMTDIAQSLGLDHGELLGLTRLLLFVEGLGDRAVLEELFGPRLRRSGIVVVPISGTKNHPVIVEGDVLLRYCATRAAVAFDSLSAKCVEQLRNDLVFRRKAYAQRGSTECKNMAQLLDAADRVERDIAPLPLDAPDMFDLLDDEVLRESFPEWPGHAEAQRAYGLDRPRDGGYWTHVRAEYGAGKEVAVLAAAAARMRELGRIPLVLEALMEKAERLADEPKLL
ncbi:MAG: hypothetical protein AB7V62_05780 [Thermoleophilia bacterium]